MLPVLMWPPPPPPTPDMNTPVEPPAPLLLPVAFGSGTQLPIWQIWPPGQTAPVQLSTHAPPAQCVPAPHIMPAQPWSTHAPEFLSHSLLIGHGAQSQR